MIIVPDPNLTPPWEYEDERRDEWEDDDYDDHRDYEEFERED